MKEGTPGEEQSLNHAQPDGCIAEFSQVKVPVFGPVVGKSSTKEKDRLEDEEAYKVARVREEEGRD